MCTYQVFDTRVTVTYRSETALVPLF